jgi:hypothetical protein
VQHRHAGAGVGLEGHEGGVQARAVPASTALRTSARSSVTTVTVSSCSTRTAALASVMGLGLLGLLTL